MGAEIIRIGIRVLEGIFAFGIVGSALVVIVAGVEDFVEIFGTKKTEPEITERT